MRGQKAANRHGKRPEDQGPGSSRDRCGRKRQSSDRQIKAEINEAQPEKGNVRETIEPAPQTGIPPEPVFPVEEQTQQEAGKESQREPKPGNQEVYFGRAHKQRRFDFMRLPIPQSE